MVWRVRESRTGQIDLRRAMESRQGDAALACDGVEHAVRTNLKTFEPPVKHD